MVSANSGGRRRKAAILLVTVWTGTALLHVSAVGFWVVASLTGLMGMHALRLLSKESLAMSKDAVLSSWSETEIETLPLVSMLVAAKNEEAVIPSLFTTLCALNYPSQRYEVWIVDDGSTDRTPELLEQLAQTHLNFYWFRRSPGSGGGKSGALNEVLPRIKGDIIGVFDADAKVPSDILQGVLPYFETPTVGAVQVRKAIANTAVNFWTRGQSVEMIFDAFWQDQRIAAGGIGELRGNGQFVRRAALESAGGWNEETITDDLDLTFRLHLNQWDIQTMLSPPVQEEGVTKAIALWHQRNRWAEGGYQRYLDYWPLLLSNRLGYRKSFDLTIFWIIQYVLPTAALPDFLLSVYLRHYPVLAPVASFTTLLSFLGVFLGLARLHRQEKQPLPLRSVLWQSLYGTFYMFHWFVVILSVTARMAVRPKRLTWIKTAHSGTFNSATSLP